MGRRIYHKDNFVYKYEFAKQGSDLSLLDTEYGIGKHNLNEDNPQYMLMKNELPALKKIIQENNELWNGFEKALSEHFKNSHGIELSKYDSLEKEHEINSTYYFNKLAKTIYDYSMLWFEKNPDEILVVFDDEW